MFMQQLVINHQCLCCNQSSIINVYAHYNDAIMGAMASQITNLTIVYSAVYSGEDQRKYQSSASSAGDRWIPAQMASNAENVSIWWRHHDLFDVWWPFMVWCYFVRTSADITEEQWYYRQVSNIRRTKSQHLKDSRTVLRPSLPNPLKPDVKSRMKM